MTEPIIVLMALNCGRCGHKWYPRREALPIYCPRCKSASWGTLSRCAVCGCFDTNKKECARGKKPTPKCDGFIGLKPEIDKDNLCNSCACFRGGVCLRGIMEKRTKCDGFIEEVI